MCLECGGFVEEEAEKEVKEAGQGNKSKSSSSETTKKSVKI